MLWVVLYLAIVPAGYGAKIESSVLYSHLGALGQSGLSPPAMITLVNLHYLYFLVLAEALLVATFIDLDLMIIPDGVTVPGTVAGLLGAAYLGAPALWPAWFYSQQELNGLQSVLPLWLINLPEQIGWLIAHPHWHGLINSILGIIVGGGSVWIIRIVGHWAFRREAMGFGDVTLMAMIGSFLGWQPSLIAFLFIAPLCALLIAVVTLTLRTAREIPFGPYLSFGAMMVVLFWRPYFSRFELFFSRGPFLVVLFMTMALLMFPMLILMRLIRIRLGFEEPSTWVEEWTSGDQLAFYANKESRETQAMSQANPWPGIPSGQGQSHANRWRQGRDS
jgi:leader peptidase (prepilin peptidase)/N-methyltransferase